MATVHTVQQGECLSSIAKKYGFADWRAIYDLPENADFKRRRPNPNIIYPGDEIFISDKQTKQESAETERKHRFEVKSSKQGLRIAVEDPEGHRIANASYELSLDGQVYRGNTNAEGLLVEQISAVAKHGRLTIGEHVWDLLISHLNPIETDTHDKGVSGAQGRLLNLGYDVGPVDAVLGPKTEAALSQFQLDGGLEVTGRLDDPTRTKLVEKHGC